MGDLAHVLCVCTANVCRSPAAELLLRTGLRSRLGDGADEQVAIASAGTWASPDRPVEPGTAQALRRAGVPAPEVAAARSTRLTRSAIAGADLVLASTAEHVRAVWRFELASRHRTFTLGELARPTSALREQRLRPGSPYVSDAYDLEDPTDNDPAQRDMVGQTAVWVEFLLDAIAGPAPARRGYRDRVPGVARALQWSRHRAARGAFK